MTETSERVAGDPLVALRSRVAQATDLIAQLRESNQSLSGELVQLRRELAETTQLPPVASQGEPQDDQQEVERHRPDGSDAPASRVDELELEGEELRDQVRILLDERELVRDKVRGVLGRLESLKG